MAGQNFIKGAIKRPGAFTRKAKAAGESVAKYATKEEHAKGRLGDEARFAKVLERINKNK